ncbi:MAG: pyridoxal phosphate-dependent aminotransferase [Thermaerobacter sp.]|nr:pyridoxal phosphate-dependent aminotransferase [Thermaerobacter sp.]
MRLAERTSLLRPSPTMALDAKAKEMERAGRSVISFGVGEPDFDTPEPVKEAAIAALRAGRTKYTPVAGIPELRKAISERFLREQGTSYPEAGVVVTAGAKQALYEIFQVLLDAGDEVIVPAPYWVTYPDQIVLAGGKPVVVPAGIDRRFALTLADLEAAATERTRAVVLNSPQNPAGAVLDPSEVVRIAEWAAARGIALISDEVYGRLVYDGAEHRSPATASPAAREATIVVDAVSKTYAMTGWRIGWLLTADVKLAAAVANLQSQSTSNTNSIAQYAALAALTGDDSALPEMLRAFAARRDLMVEMLRRLPGFEVDVPRGAFYCFPRVRELLSAPPRGMRFESADALASHLLEETGVALVPGSGFGMPEYLRLSYATSEQRIRDGLSRVAKVLGA